jgi:hypothetical protein
MGQKHVRIARRPDEFMGGAACSGQGNSPAVVFYILQLRTVLAEFLAGPEEVTKKSCFQ